MSIDQNITTLPNAPSRSDAPSEFSDKADAFVGALGQLPSELNTYATQVNAAETQIEEWYELAAAGAAILDATEWQSGTTYAEYDAVIGSDGQTYRSLVASNVGNDPTTDDGSNWARIGAEAPELVLKPEPVSPPDGETEISETPTLVASTYYSLYGKTHALSRFQVATDVDFTAIVYDSGEIAATDTHTVPSDNLVESTNYYWRVYYEDEDGVESEFSDPFEFTTSDQFFAFTPEFIGTATEGGYYAGNVFSDVDGLRRAVIVSDGDGDTNRTGAGGKDWRTSETSLPEAQTLSDGKSVMDHIVSNETLSEFPAFEWIQTTLNDTNYNSYNDWYLPARDELSLLYRFFKPTSDANKIGTRDLASDRFGADGEGHGTNKNSDPNYPEYTSSDPSQTSLTNFQEGGADYFSSPNRYWSATEQKADVSWDTSFDDGQQSNFSKTIGVSVRAVRSIVLDTPYKPANIGMEMDGGYYAGNVRSDVDGKWYAIILSDASGDTDRTGAGDKQWRTSNSALSQAQTLSDGKSVMDHIVANETLADFPAFEWIQTTLNDTSYNGFSDWYLPARDELDLVYRHFKPTTNANIGTRPTTGFGADGETYGTNKNSAPADYDGYTISDPIQTSLTNFQDGSADYLTTAEYWSSTEIDNDRSWYQDFNNGPQDSRDKDFSYRVRAVRRVQISE